MGRAFQDDLDLLRVLKQLKYFWILPKSHLATLLEQLSRRISSDVKSAPFTHFQAAWNQSDLQKMSIDSKGSGEGSGKLQKVEGLLVMAKRQAGVHVDDPWDLQNLMAQSSGMYTHWIMHLRWFTDAFAQLGFEPSAMAW